MAVRRVMVNHGMARHAMARPAMARPVTAKVLAAATTTTGATARRRSVPSVTGRHVQTGRTGLSAKAGRAARATTLIGHPIAKQSGVSGCHGWTVMARWTMSTLPPSPTR